MLTVGQILQDRYTIEAVLGQGGMGAVYQARDVSLKAPCVVKELLLPAQPSQLASLAEQFQREASILANLRHPNLPRVSNFFLEQGNYYLVMDLIKGQSLGKLIGATGLPEAAVLDYADQLLGVLEYIHGQGVLHRDIKPNNVVIQPDGRAVLVDFGLVKIIDGEKTSATMTFLHGMGTPAYAPPEQFTGGTDARSDIYSLGGLLYQALCGQAPPMALNRLAGVPLVPLRQFKKSISPNTERAVMKALELKANDRFQSAAQFRATLPGKNSATARLSGQAAPAGQSVSSRVLAGAAAVCGVLLIALAVFVVSQLSAPASPAPAAAPTVTVAAVAAATQLPSAAAQATPTTEPSPTPAAIGTGLTPTETPSPTPLLPPLVIDTDNAPHLGILGQWENRTVNQIAWSPDGKVLAGAGYKGLNIRTWSMPDGGVIGDLAGHTAPVRSAAYSPDGSMVVSGGNDRTVRLWDARAGKLLRTLTGHTDQVDSVAFSPDGRTVASASDDNTVRLWRVSDGALLHTLKGHGKAVVAVAFSPDGNLVASGSLDNTARLWNVSDGSLARELKGHTNWVWCLAFSPDGSLLATGSTDNTIRLWNVNDGSTVRRLRGHTDFVLSVAFNPGGAILASGGKDNSVRLWNVATGAPLAKLLGHVSYVGSLAWNPDGTVLASTGADGFIIFWGTRE